MGAKILIIEDDASFARYLEVVLQAEGYQVDVLLASLGATEYASETRPDLVILDVMMPCDDGFVTCARLRGVSDVPILMLTALGDSESVVKGLRLGADDYLVKDCSRDVLYARVDALLRRARPSSWVPPEPELRAIGPGLALDQERQMALVDGQMVELTPTEYRLLECLAEQPGHVCTYGEILDWVWGERYTGERHYIHVYVKNLRDKIEMHSSGRRYILNRRQVGYYLLAEPEA